MAPASLRPSQTSEIGRLVDTLVVNVRTGTSPGTVTIRTPMCGAPVAVIVNAAADVGHAHDGDNHCARVKSVAVMYGVTDLPAWATANPTADPASRPTTRTR